MLAAVADNIPIQMKEHISFCQYKWRKVFHLPDCSTWWPTEVNPGSRNRAADPSKQFCYQQSITLDTFRVRVRLFTAVPVQTQSLRFYAHKPHFGRLRSVLISRMLTIRRRRQPTLQIRQQLLNYVWWPNLFWGLGWNTFLYKWKKVFCFASTNEGKCFICLGGSAYSQARMPQLLTHHLLFINVDRVWYWIVITNLMWLVN